MSKHTDDQATDTAKEDHIVTVAAGTIVATGHSTTVLTSVSSATALAESVAPQQANALAQLRIQVQEQTTHTLSALTDSAISAPAAGIKTTLPKQAVESFARAELLDRDRTHQARLAEIPAQTKIKTTWITGLIAILLSVITFLLGLFFGGSA